MAKYSTTVTGANATLIGKVIRPRYADAFYAQVSIFGDFGGGSCALQYSPNAGTTKISLVNPLTGAAYAPTANDVVSLQPLGSADTLGGESLLYALPSSTSAALTVVLEDNR
jgi:hypothetical protein